MPEIHNRRLKHLGLCTLLGVCLLPAPAEAQIFGGRVRGWLRGNAARNERIPPDGPVVGERYSEPQIVLPGESKPNYADRSRAGDPDYGPGVSASGRRERLLSIRRRAEEALDELGLRSDGRTVRSAEGRQSVLRAPEDRWRREDLASDRADLESDIRRDEYKDEAPVESRRGERTVRVDRFEDRSSVTPAEDPYERDDSPRDRSEVTSRQRPRNLEDRSLSSREAEDRDLELRDARGRAADDELVEEPPMDRRRPREDDRVRPAAAEEADEVELPAPRDRAQADAIDDFDMPRSARDASAAKTDSTSESSAAKSATSRSSDRKTSASQPPKKPAGERERSKPMAEDAELLPPPPPDGK